MTQVALSRRDLCPRCRVWSEHKRIAVSDGIALSWCENCRVPRLAASAAPDSVEETCRPSGADPAPAETRAAGSRTPSHAWRWLSVAAPSHTR